MFSRHRAVIIAALVCASIQALDLISTALALGFTSTLAEGNAIFLDYQTGALIWGVAGVVKASYTVAVVAFGATLAWGTRMDWLGSLPIWYFTATTGRVVFHNFFLLAMELRG